MPSMPEVVNSNVEAWGVPGALIRRGPRRDCAPARALTSRQQVRISASQEAELRIDDRYCSEAAPRSASVH